MAENYVAEESYDEAIELFQRILSSNPGDSQAKNALTQVYNMVAKGAMGSSPAPAAAADNQAAEAAVRLELLKKQAEDEQRKLDEMRKAQDEARRQMEEESKRQREADEARRRADDEAAHKRVEEERRKLSEAEMRKNLEAEIRKQLEDEISARPRMRSAAALKPRWPRKWRTRGARRRGRGPQARRRRDQPAHG